MMQALDFFLWLAQCLGLLPLVASCKPIAGSLAINTPAIDCAAAAAVLVHADAAVVFDSVIFEVFLLAQFTPQLTSRCCLCCC